MFVRFYRPARPLRPYVRPYMVAHMRAADGQPLPAPKPQPPGPVQSLYFYPRDTMRTTHYG